MSVRKQLPDNSVTARLKLDDGESFAGEVINFMPHGAALMLKSGRKLSGAIGKSGTLSFSWVGETVLKTRFTIDQVTEEGILRMCNVSFLSHDSPVPIAETNFSFDNGGRQDRAKAAQETYDGTLSWSTRLGVSSCAITVTKISLSRIEMVVRNNARTLPSGVEEFELTICLPHPLGVLTLMVKPCSQGVEGSLAFGSASGSLGLAGQLLTLWVLRGRSESPAYA